jgi:NAD(P)-dependent dehydrogenase (short-subunit alcohol dehydrogenase family)
LLCGLAAVMLWVVRSVLVTGASTGIGEACALRLDRLGHRVYAGVRSEQHAHGLRQRGSDRILPVFLDVTDQAQIDGAAKQIADGGGRLDGVVNNAGIARGGPLEYLPLEIWREQLDVNVLGQVAVTKAVLPFIRVARGRIVFIGSIGGRVATMLMGPYGASKFAIEAIGESLRSELYPWGIGVSVVEPGAIKTPIWDKGRQQVDRLERVLPEEARTRYARHIAAIRKVSRCRTGRARARIRSLPRWSTRCSPGTRRPATWLEPTLGCRPCWSAGCPTGRGKRSSAGSPGRRLTAATNGVRVGCTRSP